MVRGVIVLVSANGVGEISNADGSAVFFASGALQPRGTPWNAARVGRLVEYGLFAKPVSGQLFAKTVEFVDT